LEVIIFIVVGISIRVAGCMMIGAPARARVSPAAFVLRPPQTVRLSLNEMVL